VVVVEIWLGCRVVGVAVMPEIIRRISGMDEETSIVGDVWVLVVLG